MKQKFKESIILRLKIALYILNLVGWFLLIVVPLEIFGYNLVKLENFIKSPVFSWGLKIIILLIFIFLIKGQKVINIIAVKHRWLELVLKVIFGIGIIGWIIGLFSLIF